MMATSGSFVLSRSNGKNDLSAGWNVDDDDIVIVIAGKEYRVESGNDMRSQLHWFIRSLENEHLGESLEMKACATCRHFKVSGMSLDMARGHIGSCGQHQIGVRLCHLCDDFAARTSGE